MKLQHLLYLGQSMNIKIPFATGKKLKDGYHFGGCAINHGFDGLSKFFAQYGIQIKMGTYGFIIFSTEADELATITLFGNQ